MGKCSNVARNMGTRGAGGTARDRIGAGDRGRPRQTDRRRPSVRLDGGPRTPRPVVDPRPPRSPRHRGRVRMLRRRTACRIVGGRRGRPVPPRPPRGHRHRCRRADLAWHVRPRGGDGRPVGHRREPRRAPDPVRARSARRPHPGAERAHHCALPLPAPSRLHRAVRVPQARHGPVRARDARPRVCSKGCWIRYRRVARSCPALLIRGRLEKSEGVINVVAERIDALPLDAPTKSRDFR